MEGQANGISLGGQSRLSTLALGNRQNGEYIHNYHQGFKMRFRTRLRFRSWYGKITLMQRLGPISWRKRGLRKSKTFPLRPFHSGSATVWIHDFYFSADFFRSLIILCPLTFIPKVVCKAVSASRHSGSIWLHIHLGWRPGSGAFQCWEVSTQSNIDYHILSHLVHLHLFVVAASQVHWIGEEIRVGDFTARFGA